MVTVRDCLLIPPETLNLSLTALQLSRLAELYDDCYLDELSSREVFDQVLSVLGLKMSFNITFQTHSVDVLGGSENDK